MGDDRCPRHQFLAGGGCEKGLQIGDADRVDDAQDPALVAKEAAGGIAEGGCNGLRCRGRIAQSFGPFRFLNQPVILRK